MPFIPPGYANCILSGNNAANQIWMTACGTVIESWDPDELDDLSTYLVGEDFWQNYVSDDIVATHFEVVVGTSDPSAPLTYEVSFNVTGGGTESAVPAAAYLVNKRTNLGGRKGRGRSFLPGPTEEGVNGGGNIIGDLATDPSPANDFWPDLLTSLSLGPAVLLHGDGATPPSTITSWSLASQVGLQRRRLKG